MFAIRRMFQMMWRWWPSPVFGLWRWVATADQRPIPGLNCGWGTILDSSARASSVRSKCRMLHVTPSRNCRSLFLNARKLCDNRIIIGGLYDTQCCVGFYLNGLRVAVMGNNFTYNSSEFGQSDVYTTVKTYLRNGKIHFQENVLCTVDV